LEIALSAVTDAYGKGSEHAERMRGCVRVIQVMLRTWSGAFFSFLSIAEWELRILTDWFWYCCGIGLMYFCMDDMAAIRSIINTLRIPSLETRVSALSVRGGHTLR